MNKVWSMCRLISWTTQPPSCRLWTTLLNGFNQESTYVLWRSCSSNFPYNSHITIHPYYTITEEVQQKKYADMTTGEATTINSLQVRHTVCLCRVRAMMKYLRPTRLKEWMRSRAFMYKIHISNYRQLRIVNHIPEIWTFTNLSTLWLNHWCELSVI